MQERVELIFSLEKMKRGSVLIKAESRFDQILDGDGTYGTHCICIQVLWPPKPSQGTEPSKAITTGALPCTFLLKEVTVTCSSDS